MLFVSVEIMSLHLRKYRILLLYSVSLQKSGRRRHARARSAMGLAAILVMKTIENWV